MWGMGWFGGIVMVLFWAAIIVGIFLVIRYLVSGPRGGAGTTRGADPMDILKERYARGEIGTEEFEERKKTLEAGK
jgi:putative membrane protein